MSDPRTVAVVTEALRKEATTWDEQSAVLDRISGVTGSLAVGGMDAGVFFLVTDTYETARSLIQTWCAQGAVNTAAIADELRRNAVAYETTEVDVTATVEGAY